ncbi:hypothetical protein DER44DRAFT_322077 [Fusarium oxysporum]|nr:hypothetical protein DER44DRAFT_322077 [Fusarium oxysporum]
MSLFLSMLKTTDPTLLVFFFAIRGILTMLCRASEKKPNKTLHDQKNHAKKSQSDTTILIPQLCPSCEELINPIRPTAMRLPHN